MVFTPESHWRKAPDPNLRGYSLGLERLGLETFFGTSRLDLEG